MTRFVPTNATRAGVSSATRRRNLMVGIAVGLLCGLLTVIGIATAINVVSNVEGRRAMARQDWAGAEGWFSHNLRLNWFDPWLAHYNSGVAMYYQADWDGATSQFRAALPLAPDDQKCHVAMNLSWALEGKGDAYRSMGDTARAAHTWAAARKIAVDANCSSTSSPRHASKPSDRDRGSEAQQRRDTRARLTRKIHSSNPSAESDARSEQQSPEQRMRQLSRDNQNADRHARQQQDHESSTHSGKGGRTW